MPPPVKLPRRRPYRILRSDTPIYTPRPDYPHTEIVSPDRPAQWRWHQRDDQERQVSQGEYAVLLYPENTDTCQANFRILNSGLEPSKERAMKRGERAMWAGNSLLAIGTAFFDPLSIFLGLSLGAYGIRNKEYAIDPPDPEFKESVRLSERTFRLEPARTPAVEAAQEFAISAIRCADLVDAVRISLERIQAALAEDANDSVRARFTDFRRFASLSIMADIELARRLSQLEHYLIDKNRITGASLRQTAAYGPTSYIRLRACLVCLNKKLISLVTKLEQKIARFIEISMIMHNYSAQN
jgi:hypothetical protein